MAGISGERLVFDPDTGKLFDEDLIPTPGLCHAVNFDVPAEKDKLSVYVDGEEKVVVKTMRLSSKSDTYQRCHKYGGVIIYLYNGKSDWRTHNHTHCMTGYIVIQDTDSENVKKWKGEEPGVHGAVYRNAFDESVKKADVVGEGFSFRNRFEKVSNTFNKPPGSKFHDTRETMNEASAHCVRKIVDHWIFPRNYEVKELLEDYQV